MTPQTLKSQTRATLEQMARRRGIAGINSMRKDELIRAILKVLAAGKRTTAEKSTTRKKPTSPVVSPPKRTVLGNSSPLPQRSRKLDTPETTPAKEVLALLVRGPYWLHAHWSLSPQTLRRAEVALGSEWYQSTPELQLYVVPPRDADEPSDHLLQRIEIHGGVNDWYLPVDGVQRTYRAVIGYKTHAGRFFPLCRSNLVNPPPAGNRTHSEAHWTDVAQNCDEIYAMSGGYDGPSTGPSLKNLIEERTQRSLTPPVQLNASRKPGMSSVASGVQVRLSAELIIHGSTTPETHVTCDGKPVPVDSLQGFRVKLPLVDGRQIIPVVATNPRTSEQQTVILAIERHTRELDLRTPEDL